MTGSTLAHLSRQNQRHFHEFRLDPLAISHPRLLAVISRDLLCTSTGPIACSAPRTGKALPPCDWTILAKPILWKNQRSCDDLKKELANAKELHVIRISIVNPSSIAGISANGRVFKWVVSEHGGLFGLPVIMPGDNLKHTVATGGRPVLAAGEARAWGNVVFIDNHSGHYKPDPSSLCIAELKFEAAGFRVQRITD